MKTFLLSTILICSAFLSVAQYQIGHVNLEYYDEVRERWIDTHMYYPSDIGGEESAISESTFPYLVFGHGFSMNYSDYDYLWEFFVPRGYILVMPATESGLSPNHETYGKDIAFLAENFYEINIDIENYFFGHVEPICAIMGHSMGGGASHLAGTYTEQINCIVTFAAAETDPSAIEAAANSVDVPVIVFYGEGDAVAPPDENQIPIYNASNSSCKTLINVLGGIHCYFAESQWACDFGETMAGSDAEIEREEQHNIVCDILSMYFDYELKGNTDAGIAYLDSLENSTRIDVTRDCSTTYTIDAEANPTNTGTIAGTGTYEQNQTCTLVASANNGFEFVNWTENGNEVSNNSTYEFVVSENRSLIANFQDNVSVNSNITDNIYIYPNPTNEILNFANLPANAKHILIYSINGKLVNQQPLNAKVNISQLESGQYIINILTADKELIYTERISKK
ncbi:MAG: T9SS type A sorting domain-containing protein [Bacteroidales bacterium]|nr:T9SS type A sorting domain-containing protein [Bacteroidales bacterium]